MEIHDEKKFIEGFNAGYILYFYEPGLLNLLPVNKHTHSEYLNGLFQCLNHIELEIQLKEFTNFRTSRNFEREI